ncbi:MAG: hypothetical protein JNM63_12675 [Spirochaetia bacterium]|nr:hypothetical protein [Spirochaetia bacterium]
MNGILFEESNNIFFLYEIAKASFWTEGGKAFSLRCFQKMEKMIEESTNKWGVVLTPSQYSAGKNIVLVDMWFPDLYYKVACILLDFERNSEAVTYFAKTFFVLRENDPGNSAAFEQALGFFVEALWKTKNPELNFFFNYAKMTFPENTYILQFKPDRK